MSWQRRKATHTPRPGTRPRCVHFADFSGAQRPGLGAPVPSHSRNLVAPEVPSRLTSCAHLGSRRVRVQQGLHYPYYDSNVDHGSRALQSKPELLSWTRDD